MRTTHLTHQKPRRSGATIRAGKPCPALNGSPPAWVTSHSRSRSRIGNLRGVAGRGSDLDAAGRPGIDETVEPDPLPVLFGVPAAGAVQNCSDRLSTGVSDLADPVGDTVDVEAPVGCLHALDPVVEPLCDGHAGRVERGSFVRAGESSFCTLRTGRRQALFPRRPDGGRERCQSGGPEEGAAAEIAGRGSHRMGSIVHQQHRQSDQATTDVDLHDGQRPDSGGDVGRMDQPGRQRGDDEAEQKVGRPARRPPTSCSTRDDRRLPGCGGCHGKTGHGVDHGWVDRPVATDRVREESAQDGSRTEDQQCQIRASPRGRVHGSSVSSSRNQPCPRPLQACVRPSINAPVGAGETSAAAARPPRRWRSATASSGGHSVGGGTPRHETSRSWWPPTLKASEPGTVRYTISSSAARSVVVVYGLDS